MLVRHAMTRSPFTVGPDDLCLDVMRTFRARGFRHAPVVDDGKLVGVVSERDLARALPALVGSFAGGEGRKSVDAPVRSVMTSKAEMCSPSDPVDVVARRMLDGRLGCMPVVADDVLVGIVTTVDLLQSFTDHLLAGSADALTLLWSRGGMETLPDVPALVVGAGARLTGYFVTETDAGALAVLARIEGTPEQRTAFRENCSGAGLLFMAPRSAA